MNFPQRFRLQSIEVIQSRALPEGFALMTAGNSVAIVAPNGKVYAFKRRDEFSDWEPDIRPAMEAE